MKQLQNLQDLPEENVVITRQQIFEIIDGLSVVVAPITFSNKHYYSVLYGRPLIPNGEDYICFYRCEYCGTKEWPNGFLCSKCGAPIGTWATLFPSS